MALVALSQLGVSPDCFCYNPGWRSALCLTSRAAISCVMTLTRGRILSCETNYSRQNFIGDVIRHLRWLYCTVGYFKIMNNVNGHLPCFIEAIKDFLCLLQRSPSVAMVNVYIFKVSCSETRYRLLCNGTLSLLDAL